jgi:hypothetical protein
MISRLAAAEGMTVTVPLSAMTTPTAGMFCRADEKNDGTKTRNCSEESTWTTRKPLLSVAAAAAAALPSLFQMSAGTPPNAT